MISSSINFSRQRNNLFEFLNSRNLEISFDSTAPEILEVKQASQELIQLISRNFDIVRLISSARALNLRPGTYGEVRREFGFNLIVPENLPIVAVIDSGVEQLQPIREAITNIGYSHTNLGTYFDELGHGTMVAGLVILGEDFIKEIKTDYIAKAKIAVIKAIHNNNDPIDVPRLLADIRDAKRRHNIKLFNMSLNMGIIKSYNDKFCDFAYELDKVAFEEDILIFVSVGNYNFNDLENLRNNSTNPSHSYPRFFYDLASSSVDHSCWFTNIQEPSETMNNVSIGAIASNLEGDSDETPAPEYPAFYTRKFHFDYNQEVNGTELGRNQANKHLNKPDLVFDGGDVFSYEAGIEVLRSPINENERFYGRTCGTSLASPFITSYAAELLHRYPNVRTQTIKALLINSSYSVCGKNPPAFRGDDNKLLRKLIGFGKPSKINLVETNENTVVFVIEDEINLEELKTIPINIPDYVARNENKLHFEVSLCYSFLPVKHNHLSYLPLHISFGIFKPVDASFIANRNADEYTIKAGLSWSEDFHGIENRLFSNAQKTTFNLKPSDIRNVENAVSLAIRCTSKSEIPEVDKSRLASRSHQYSLIISISEIPQANASNRLYNEITAINTIENLVTLEGDADLEIENSI